MIKFLVTLFVISLSFIFTSEKPANESSLSKNEIYKEVFFKHIAKINHLEKENKSMLILFSGTPGMGKSTIAKKLEDKLSAIRISSDEVRNIFREMRVDPKHIQEDSDFSYIGEYLLYLFNALDNTSKNHLFILDMSCDRSYSMMKHLSEIYNYPLYVIRLQLPYELAKNRIISREEHPEQYLKFLDKWYCDYEKFDKSKCNYFIDVSVPIDEFPINNLADQINSKSNLLPQQKNL